MAFTIKHPVSGLFWSSGIFGRVQLGPVPNVYALEGSYIKNTATGNYVNHSFLVVHEGGNPDEFSIGDDGVIMSGDLAVGDGQFLSLGVNSVPWVIVPQSRASALIAEAQAPEPEEPEEPEEA